MAYSIVQNQISASGTTSGAGTTTASLTWSPAPVNGHLLLVGLTFRSNATVTESTTQGWIKAATVTNGTAAQTDLWYRVAGAGEGTTGPSFTIPTATLYEIVQVEVAGFTGTPTLDQTGTNGVGTGVATQTETVSGAIGAANEFVYACCGNEEGNTSGITWSAPTAGGGATLGADISNVAPAKNGEGLDNAWATSGAAGTSPSLTFNTSASTNTHLAGCIATFRNVFSRTATDTIGSYSETATRLVNLPRTAVDSITSWVESAIATTTSSVLSIPFKRLPFIWELFPR